MNLINYLIITHNFWMDLAEKLIDFMEIPQGAKLLDVETGYEACLIAAARKVGKIGYLIGIDVNKERKKDVKFNCMNHRIQNATLKVMDAQNMLFSDASFDSVTCGFIG